MNKPLAFGAGFAFVVAAGICATAAQTVGIGAVVAGLTLFGVGAVAALGLGFMSWSLQSKNAGAVACGATAAATLGAALLFVCYGFDFASTSTTVSGMANYIFG